MEGQEGLGSPVKGSGGLRRVGRGQKAFPEGLGGEALQEGQQGSEGFSERSCREAHPEGSEVSGRVGRPCQRAGMGRKAL